MGSSWHPCSQRTWHRKSVSTWRRKRPFLLMGLQGYFCPGPAAHRASWLWPHRPPGNGGAVFILACLGAKVLGSPTSSALGTLPRIWQGEETGSVRVSQTCHDWHFEWNNSMLLEIVLHNVRCPLNARGTHCHRDPPNTHTHSHLSSAAWRGSQALGWVTGLRPSPSPPSDDFWSRVLSSYTWNDGCSCKQRMPQHRRASE